MLNRVKHLSKSKGFTFNEAFFESLLQMSSAALENRGKVNGRGMLKIEKCSLAIAYLFRTRTFFCVIHKARLDKRPTSSFFPFFRSSDVLDRFQLYFWLVSPTRRSLLRTGCLFIQHKRMLAVNKSDEPSQLLPFIAKNPNSTESCE